MNRLQLLAVLAALLSVAKAGLLPGDNGYQYDRPNLAADFGRRTNGDVYSRYRPNTAYGLPLTNGFTRQPGNFGYQGYNGYQGYQGYQGTQQGYQGGNFGYQDYQANGLGGYRRFDGSDSERQGPRAYSFQYEVRDAASGNDYGQQESGDARGVVRGEYRVLLPDSRTQIVRYRADDANGYVADVRYEGQAQYPRTNLFGFANGNGNNYQQVAPGRAVSEGGGGGGGGGGGSSRAGVSNQYLPPYGK